MGLYLSFCFSPKKKKKRQKKIEPIIMKNMYVKKNSNKHNTQYLSIIQKIQIQTGYQTMFICKY